MTWLVSSIAPAQAPLEVAVFGNRRRVADLLGYPAQRSQQARGVGLFTCEVLEAALGDALECLLALILGQRLEDDEESVDCGGGRHVSDRRAIRAANRAPQPSG